MSSFNSAGKPVVAKFYTKSSTFSLRPSDLIYKGDDMIMLEHFCTTFSPQVSPAVILMWLEGGVGEQYCAHSQSLHVHGVVAGGFHVLNRWNGRPEGTVILK